ncbi:MAG: hypothetical protein Q8S29_08695 [Phreatobacter sp.]|nr:hypothetical protein [Phreatobacter sp.]
MDAREPLRVGFIGRIGRQAVDHQVFAGTEVAKRASPEIDLDAADQPDALDPLKCLTKVGILGFER